MSFVVEIGCPDFEGTLAYRDVGRFLHPALGLQFLDDMVGIPEQDKFEWPGWPRLVVDKTEVPENPQVRAPRRYVALSPVARVERGNGFVFDVQEGSVANPAPENEVGAPCRNGLAVCDVLGYVVNKVDEEWHRARHPHEAFLAPIFLEPKL